MIHLHCEGFWNFFNRKIHAVFFIVNKFNSSGGKFKTKVAKWHGKMLFFTATISHYINKHKNVFWVLRCKTHRSGITLSTALMSRNIPLKKKKKISVWGTTAIVKKCSSDLFVYMVYKLNSIKFSVNSAALHKKFNQKAFSGVLPELIYLLIISY